MSHVARSITGAMLALLASSAVHAAASAQVPEGDTPTDPATPADTPPDTPTEPPSVPAEPTEPTEPTEPAEPPASEPTDTAPSDPEPDADTDDDDDDDDDDAPASLWPSRLQAAGFVDTYFQLGFQNPDDRTLELRAFDSRTNEFALNYAEVALWMSAEPVGFRIDVGFGPTAAIVHSLDPGTPELLQHLQQAYGSAHFDVGGGLTLDVGKFVTPHGQEVIETRDNWAYSRSILFTWAIPFYHFGLRVNYVFSEAFNATLYAVNGWNNVVDNNDGKTFGLSLAIHPIDMLTAYVNYMVGPEQADQGDIRHLIDATVLLTPIPMLQLGLNFDLGLEAGVDVVDPMTEEVIDENDVSWMGLAFSARIAPTDWFAVAVRGEWFNDADGFATGTDQRLFEGTLTLEARYATNFIARLEYRHDQSSESVFDDGDEEAGSESQDTITLGAIVGF